jgi:drug/metabolite transporter (DMT)-like permease
MMIRLMILVVTINTVVSMLLLKRAVTVIGAPSGWSSLPRFFLEAAASPLVYASLVLQVIGYAIWMLVIAQEKLGVAVALSGSAFYVLTALASWYIYGEKLSAVQWAGIAFITVGVICVSVKTA